jgi:hypothetical protein
MKTEAELSINILKMTMTIRNEFPELMKFLNEMPETIPNKNNPEITINNLQEYYDSLEDLLRKYAPNHVSFITDF